MRFIWKLKPFQVECALDRLYDLSENNKKAVRRIYDSIQWAHQDSDDEADYSLSDEIRTVMDNVLCKKHAYKQDLRGILNELDMYQLQLIQ